MGCEGGCRGDLVLHAAQVAASKPGRSVDRFEGMRKVASWTLGVLAVAVLLACASGCKSSSGSREFIPGKGWRPT